MPARLLINAFAAILLVWFVSTPMTTLAQERVTIPGTTVSLKPHPDFAIARDFSGLLDTASGASVLIAEFPATAFPDMVGAFSDPEQAAAGLARQGMTFDSFSEIRTGSETAPLVRARQPVAGVTFRKWITVLGGARTVLITVQAPPESSLDDEGVVAMLGSISLVEPPTLSMQIELLPFRVSVVEPFRAVGVIGGSTLAMTAGPKDADPGRSQPVVMISWGMSPVVQPEEARPWIAEAQLEAMSAIREVEVGSRRRATFAGMDAVVLEGVIEGGARRFVQYFGFGEDGSQIVLIALAPAASFAAVDGAIKAIADSIVPAE